MSKFKTLSERVEALVPHAEDCLLHANIVALVEGEVQALTAQLEAHQSVERDDMQFLCEKCNCVHPSNGNNLLQLCPGCGFAMLPSSFNGREIRNLRQQLLAAREQMARLEELQTKNEGRVKAIVDEQLLAERDTLQARVTALSEAASSVIELWDGQIAQGTAYHPYRKTFETLRKALTPAAAKEEKDE